MDNFERIKQSKPIKAPRFVVTNSNIEQGNSSADKTNNPTPKSSSSKGLLGMLDFKNMAMDADRSVILMLIALLSNKSQQTDDLLIMALLYIML